MKRLIAIAATLAFASLAGAQQLYKYIDKDGKTVYTDQPPPNVQSKAIAAPPPPPSAPAKAAAAAASKSAVERDKDAEKAREQARDAQKKQQDLAQKTEQAEQRCTQARAAYQTYAGGGRIMKTNDKGERVYLSDEELASGREKARQDMEEACKKS